MKFYNNVPSQQRLTQRLVDEFNADEQMWQSLEWERVQHRWLQPHLSAKRHRLLDLLEFDKARPPQDCIGTFFYLRISNPSRLPPLPFPLSPP